MLAQTPFAEPKVPVLANVNCKRHTDAGNIRQSLTDQLTHPVRWQETMEKLISDGVEQFVEIGPGRVLTGLMKKISRRMPVMNISTADDVAALSATMGRMGKR